MKNRPVTDAAAAARTIGIELTAPEQETLKQYPFLANDYLLSRIDPAAGRSDPVWKQIFPDPAELSDMASSFDPLAEEEQMPCPRLIHRFTDRALLLTTGRCALRCRFCFRKRTWKSGSDLADLTPEELENAAVYLEQHPEVREILLSGGDPLMLDLESLKRILDRLSRIPSIAVLRIGSRMPSAWPERVTAACADMLASYPNLWLLTHFNHPNEWSPEARGACFRLTSRGVPVLNQCVLLAGVNDDAETLENLFRTLTANRVKPHYLFHVDPVRGVRHFATGIEAGLAILREFRGKLSSLAVPTFAIDLPEGGGKVALQPDYRDGVNRYRDIHDRKSIVYPERLQSDE